MKSLLENKDNSRIETFNSVIAKHIDEKRINFDLRGSYEARCNTAVVTFNIGEPISRLSYTLGTKPGEIATQLENEKKIRAQAARNCTSGTKKWSTQNIKRAVADKNYGPQANKCDIS